MKVALQCKHKRGRECVESLQILTEFFDSLATLDAPVLKEEQVLHLPTSLPDSYRMVVSALEAILETVQE